MSLIDHLKKNSQIAETAILEKSKLFTTTDMIPTPIPAINVALSGKLDGGLTPGVTVFAGPSRHFKTAFTLLLAKSYLDKYPDSAILFYDSEFGAPLDYFKSFGIDTSRVVHTPVTDLEQLTFDLMGQLNALKRGDKVFILIDSLGNIASKKEVEDALDGKSVADMTRAKKLKGLMRMVTPHLTLKDIPLVAVNHTYKEIGLYPRDIVSGGTGVMYSADNVYIIGRQQDKEGTELNGYKFIINVEKSRFVKEKSKIPIEVSFEGGISKWSGLLDLALESGHVVKPSNGWYQKKGEEKKYREKDTYAAEFWNSILEDPTFSNYLYNKYSLSSSSLVADLEDDFIKEEFENA